MLTFSVETPANMKPDQAIAQLAALADRLQCVAATEIDGVAVFAGPGDNVRALFDKYEAACARGSKLAMISGGR